ncbi:MAG: hypothetical protein M1814_004256 [Vezdaea aestivalis]|nr:MAG: hypothetical protein M1814_004256 [Vezdaea aestivalis]
MFRGHEGRLSAERAHRPGLPPSMSAPNISKPLLQNPSQYTDTFAPSAAIATSSTTLAELAHLVRLQSYQEQKRSYSRLRLRRWLVSTALNARLVRCGELAHRTLVDDFRTDDTHAFASLYNGLHDVRLSCDSMKKFALMEPELAFGKPKQPKSETRSFIQELPTATRECLLGFLGEIRNNPHFLADRIASLNQAELAALASHHHQLDPVETVMPVSSKGKGLNSTSKNASSSGPSAIQRLLSFQRHDPLSALLNTVFASSSGPDSAEDRLRLDVWSTTCARLITEGKSGSEQFMLTLLNTVAAMREWPVKANLELYLMKILQDGAFLLERTDESSLKVEGRSTKETIAADDFYDKAVIQFFEVIDSDPSAGGFPEGVLELGNAIIRKLEESKKIRAAQTFIVSRWFFSTFLLNAIVHPESHGIMSGHYINDFARQVILKQVAIRAQKLVLDMTYNLKQPKPILPEIRTHIDKIIACFRNPRGLASKPVLLPARTVASPRETIEIQPFLVICPADIVTLATTLFPERQTSSGSVEQGLKIRGLQSSASSLSGLSTSVQTPSSMHNHLGDSSSLLSQSASSITSDITSREPLLDTADGLSSATSTSSSHARTSMPIEEYAQEVKTAITDMTRQLGTEAVSGSCHPCAEQYSVLFVDGKKLETRMRKDFDDDEDEEDDSHDSDSEDEAPEEKIDLAVHYHALKEAIVKLVEEWEIPKELAPESESKEFSNRASNNRHRARRLGAPGPAAGGEQKSNNPYHTAPAHQGQISAMIASQREAVPERRRPQHGRTSSLQEGKASEQQERSVLLTMLETAVNQCNARGQYLAANTYHNTWRQLLNLRAESLKKNGFGPLLNLFSRGPRDSLSKAGSAIEEFEAWFVWLKQFQERLDGTTEAMMDQARRLRDKMWFMTDVRNSGPFEDAKRIILALKAMNTSSKSSKGVLFPRPKGRNQTNFLLKAETQTVDLITAPADQGGLHKLSDEQSERTVKYLNEYKVENFCKGEERIHRFCLEVDLLVGRITGNDMSDGPVLWSSDLFLRDKRMLDSGRQKGDLHLTGVGTLSIAGDEEYETESVGTAFRSPDLGSRPSSQGLRTISTMNVSQQSFESGQWSTSRSNGRFDPIDASRRLSIDTSQTFWSPFQSPMPSHTTLRPRTASTSNDTVMLQRSDSVNKEKRIFLAELKQTLTGLLLSDLGALIFNQGSETDNWFSGELGDECFQRIDETEEAERRRKRAIAKKRSIRNLRAGRCDQTHSAGENSSSSDATARSSGMSVALKGGLFEFPYNVAFRRLLHKFSTHPNPFVKLQALYELELLIVASLNTRTGKAYNATRRDILPTAPMSPSLGALSDTLSREPGPKLKAAKDLNGTISNVQSRRSYTTTHRSHSPTRSGIRSPGGTIHPQPSKDMVVDVLRGLFRDAAIRPHALFRDLQFVASFVPASILDKTDCGNAFWDTALAALSLKQDVCRSMVEMADEIQTYHTEQQNEARRQNAATTTTPSAPATITATEPAAPTSPLKPTDDLARFSMSDVGHMWVILAKEGEPTAERELATFYLTHPDLIPRETQPLCKPREVFKAASKQRNDDPLRSDPNNMCLAYHWMDSARLKGDDLAGKYLRQRDEFAPLS